VQVIQELPDVSGFVFYRLNGCATNQEHYCRVILQFYLVFLQKMKYNTTIMLLIGCATVQSVEHKPTNIREFLDNLHEEIRQKDAEKNAQVTY
jgi:hypothetical protein